METPNSHETQQIEHEVIEQHFFEHGPKEEMRVILRIENNENNEVSVLEIITCVECVDMVKMRNERIAKECGGMEVRE